MDKEHELQHRMEELELLRAQGETMQQQLLLIEKTLEEIMKTKEALEGMKGAKAGSEILFPLGSGVYGKGKLVSADEVVVNLGADVVAARSVGDAEKALEKQMEKIGEARKSVGEGLLRLERDVQVSTDNIQKMLKAD